MGAWPRGLQVGGGITDGNARGWVEDGAEKVCSMFMYIRRGSCLRSTGIVGHNHIVSFSRRSVLSRPIKCRPRISRQ